MQVPATVRTEDKGLLVLVVDDEPLLLWALSEALAARGHEVLTAGDGAAALALLSGLSRRPDVILLDYRLPGEDGVALLPAIRGASPASRIIMVTAYGTPELETRALAFGALRVAQKPIDMDRVADLVA